MSTEKRNRIIEAINETSAILDRATQYAPDLRDYDLIDTYETIRKHLVNLLSEDAA